MKTCANEASIVSTRRPMYPIGYSGQTLEQIEAELASQYARVIGEQLTPEELQARQRKGRRAA